MPNSGKTQRQIVWAVVALFAITMGAIVVVALFYKGDATQVITSLLAAVGPIVAVIAAMRQVGNVETKVDQVAADTHALTNGLLDAKVRAAAAEVLPDELVDPDYQEGKRSEDAALAAEVHNGGVSS